MSLSRRSFVKTVGAGGAGALALPLVVARGESWAAGALAPGRAGILAGQTSVRVGIAALRAASPGALRLDSNENPNGPGEVALAAIGTALGEVARYPDAPTSALRDAVARLHGVAPENVLLGCGSSEVLCIAAHTWTSPARPLVTAAPTFEDPAAYAAVAGASVRAVPVTGGLTLDLAAMAARAAEAPAAGLVYLCNPNNPTATLHHGAAVRDFVRRVGRESPATTILVDEAYFDYVEDPAYETAIPLALESPRVVVTRTFSKIYGMAGLRVGYAVAHRDTIARMQPLQLPSSISGLGVAAAAASVGGRAHLEAERARNREARELTRRFFEGAGYRTVPSQTNFLMADIRRSPKAFQDACRARGVLVGRPFPPLDSHARISIGTVDEMRRATEVFAAVLSQA